MKKKICVALLIPVVVSSWSFAQTVQSIAEREVSRRQSGIGRGEAALVQGRAAMDAKDYLRAHESYRAACQFLPDGTTSGSARNEAARGFCESGVKLAEQRTAQGRYGEAEQIVREIVSDRYDARCKDAEELLHRLHNPDAINRTMGPKFIAKVEDVRRLLDEAEGFYQSGRYDLAMKRYDQVLALDPYNVAARRGQERVDNTKTHFGHEAYNETRARQLWQVQKGWEEPVRQYGKPVGPINDVTTKDVTGTARITNKLNSIIIHKIDFKDASIREAIDFIRQQAAANDPTTEGRRGIDIVLRLTQIGRPASESAAPTTGESSLTPANPGQEGSAAPPVAAPVPAPVVQPPSLSPSEARITITLNEIPLGEALRYVASQAGLKVKVEPYAVSIMPISEQSSDLFTKEYRVPPGFISTSVNIGTSAFATSGSLPAAPGAAAAPAIGTGKDTQESTGGRQLVNREGAREFLESQGVQFPPGASAHFLPDSSRLIVRNTEDNLELVDALVEQANVSGPKQVEIEAKFVEINQNNLKELGFDWLLGQFNIGNQRVFGGGGTQGTSPPLNPADFPFIGPNNVPVGRFPVTGGNRSGNLAISANAIDSLLFGMPGASALAPGIFGLSGVFTDPQFQVVIRALNQKKGIDLLSAPRVTTKSGQRAVIEIVREFRYPTQFTEPKVPDIQGRGSSNSTTTTIALPVVGPSTPSNFETRNTGVTLEVEPVVGPDGVTIDLNLVPQVVEFEGFINYGSPISTVNPALLGFLGLPGNILGTQQSIVLTDNVINQPIFSSRKVTTSVSVFDGQTVVLGGLMREDVQKTEDRTPIIGDIPVVGRLFRTNAEQHIKRNLVIFVTARLITPGGQLVNQTEEEEETEEIEPPVLPEVPMYKK
jgi:general secretion pathway protein D